MGKAFDIQWLRQLGDLAERIAGIEQRSRVGAASTDPPPAVATGWPAVDEALGGLRRGAVHEWLAYEQAGEQTGSAPTDNERARSSPNRASAGAAPLCVLSHLAYCAIQRGGFAVWIGRACWPYPHTLVRDGDADRLLLERSVFVDPPDRAARLWAMDVSLRCAGVAVVVADATAMSLAATRRLQLAARAGRTLGLLARPPTDRRTPSAAATRWAVRPIVSPTRQPRWALELFRCKGAGRSQMADPVEAKAQGPDPGRLNPTETSNENTPGIVVEWNGATGVIAVPADLVDRPDSTANKKIA